MHPEYSDADAAALYDVLNPWGAGHPEDEFVTGYVLAADAVLDVGCGTGSMLHHARDRGHTGRLTGLDPDLAMLQRARRRRDVEWVPATAAQAPGRHEFDLATMTGNAFQCLVADRDVRDSLTAIRASLRENGRFLFGTRHPQAREWEQWRPDNAIDLTDHDGRELRMWHDVEGVAGDVVALIEVTALRDGTVLRTDRARLRFLDLPALNAFLTGAGFMIEHQYGDWCRNPITPASREIITVARATDRR